MRKIKIFLRRVGSMSFKRMFMIIGTVHQQTDVNRVYIFFDMIYCAFFRGVGYLDYSTFGFAKIRGKKRDTFMTMNHNHALVGMLNDKEYFEVFTDKLQFNARFRAYLGRDYINLQLCDSKGLKDFCQGKQSVFAKQAKTFGGQGIERVDLSAVQDFEALYARLTENKQFLVEDTIVQHEKMDRLSPSSINTIRMVTLVVDGQAHFMYAIQRMGAGNSAVDNICSGGMYTRVFDGVLKKPAFRDKDGQYYDRHPVTGTVFDGFEIPYFRQAVDLVCKAALVEPHMKYIGWDVAITPTGPVLVEGNNFPSYDMVQNHGHLPQGSEGILPVFEKVIGKKIQ